MTHYFESILPKVLSYSQKLDKLALLLNEPWVVVGDHIVQSKLIFRTDGNILVSENGAVTFGKWELLNRANSMLIEYANSVKLYNQAFFDEAILALRLDGTQEFFILANQNKIPDLDVIKYIMSRYSNKTDTSARAAHEIYVPRTTSYKTSKGEIIIHFSDSPLETDEAYLNNRPAPDGKYKIGHMDYIHVMNGRVYKTTLF